MKVRVRVHRPYGDIEFEGDTLDDVVPESGDFS
jgi:hypothetical protein